MVTISYHSNQNSYPIGEKTKQSNSFPLPVDAICEIWQESASEEMSFENVDDDNGRRRTDDGCLPIL